MLHSSAWLRLVFLTVLLLGLAVPKWTAAPASETGSESGRATSTVDREPAEPNPYLAFLPADARPNYRYWQRRAKAKAAERRSLLPALGPKLDTAEHEPNDSRMTANPIAGFGSGPGDDPVANITGSITAVAAATPIGPFAEDEGSIPLANSTGVTTGTAVVVSGTIGDAAFSNTSGDFDFFEIPDVKFGELIVIDVDTASPFEALDPFIALYDSGGNIVAFNEDEDADVTFDSFLAVTAPADGDYYLSIGGSVFPLNAVLLDPFDSTSGNTSLTGSQGEYTVTIRLEDGDQDWFSIDLESCDILGANLTGAGTQLLVVGPNGTLLIASSQDLSGLAYPSSSPLPGGGRATLAHAAAAAGTYSIRVFGNQPGDYTLELRVFRPPLEEVREPKTLFVDFDGATVDPAIFGAPAGTATLSPLSAFLTNWGLTGSDEDAVIDAILASLEENLQADLTASGLNRTFGVTLLNSRDHADPFGDPNVSRLIIGGSIPELGLATIGIAESIDPGNFATAETGVVLLDLLSGSASDPNSLNSFPLAPGVGIIDLIGVAVGNIAAHEAGHYTGNFHTAQFNQVTSLMDQGGNLPNSIGVGIDGIFGTIDDLDVDFSEDLFVPNEGFAGFEDTRHVMLCGCTTDGVTVFSDNFESGLLDRWTSVVP